MDQFPASRFDDLTLLAQTPGSFWTEIFNDRELIFDLLRGYAAQERQLEQLLAELYDSMGRQTCPVFHTDWWHPLILTEGTGQSASVLRYGDDLVYGPQPDTAIVYTYGDNKDPSWQYPAPADLAATFLLTDAVVQPNVCLCSGVEFYLAPARQQLVFARDPFLDERFTPFTATDGVRRLRLYLFAAQLDWQFVPKLYGSIVGLQGPSSPAFKELTNVILDGVASGTAREQIAAALAVLTGIPRAAGTETVEVITTNAQHLLIITDQQVYRYRAWATPLVAVGDQVAAGQDLVDAVQVFEPNRGQIPDGVTALAVSKGLLLTSVGDELIFADRAVPLTVITGVSGYTKVTFPLGGFAADVAAFFTEIHARGVAAGTTLANYLDLRDPELQVGQPTARQLPTTVNPLQLLMHNVLRHAVILAQLKLHDLGDAGAGLQYAGVLRRILPPHVALLLLFELQDLTDDATMDGDGSTTATGYTESYELFVV
jgi:hypothetical protein